MKIIWFAGAALLGLLSFAIASANAPWLTGVVACLVGILAVAFLRFVAVEAGETLPFHASALAAVAALAGALLHLAFAGDFYLADLVAIPVAVLAAFLFSKGVARQQVAVCSVCKAPLAGRAVFVCPRCHQSICSQPTCWKGQHARCRLCDEREVVIFPPHDAWWTERLGKRMRDGTCHSCYKEAHETDLRECGQCHWPSCRRCWDYNNGRCARCGWVMPGLPSALQPYVAPAAGRRDAARR